jgi:hypothetical protein
MGFKLRFKPQILATGILSKSGLNPQLNGLHSMWDAKSGGPRMLMGNPIANKKFTSPMEDVTSRVDHSQADLIYRNRLTSMGLGARGSRSPCRGNPESLAKELGPWWASSRSASDRSVRRSLVRRLYRER